MAEEKNPFAELEDEGFLDDARQDLTNQEDQENPFAELEQEGFLSNAPIQGFEDIPDPNQVNNVPDQNQTEQDIPLGPKGNPLPQPGLIVGYDAFGNPIGTPGTVAGDPVKDDREAGAFDAERPGMIKSGLTNIGQGLISGGLGLTQLGVSVVDTVHPAVVMDRYVFEPARKAFNIDQPFALSKVTRRGVNFVSDIQNKHEINRIKNISNADTSVGLATNVALSMVGELIPDLAGMFSGASVVRFGSEALIEQAAKKSPAIYQMIKGFADNPGTTKKIISGFKEAVEEGVGFGGYAYFSSPLESKDQSALQASVGGAGTSVSRNAFRTPAGRFSGGALSFSATMTVPILYNFLSSVMSDEEINETIDENPSLAEKFYDSATFTSRINLLIMQWRSLQVVQRLNVVISLL